MKKVISTILAVVLTIAMVVPTAAAASTGTATGTELELIPIRPFFENEIGAIVEWVDEDRAIVIFVEGGTVVMFADDTHAYTNDVPLTLEFGVIMIQNHAFMTMDDLFLLLTAFIDTNVITLELTEEARDIALQDFDYLVNFTLANSAWDNVIYRSLGIDFDAHVAAHRAAIENMVPITVPNLSSHFPIRDCDDPLSIAANYLISLLAFSFDPPFQGIGHLGVRDITMYQLILAITQRGYHSAYATDYSRTQIRTAFGAYVDPRAIWFYGEYEFEMDIDGGGWPEVPGNIVTEVLVPGEVAYLQIRSFLACHTYDSLTIRPFIQEVQEFDHLIIDIRGNLGGAMDHFAQSIFIPLATGATAISSYQFFAGGAGAVSLMDAYLQLFLSLGLDEDVFYAGIHPISDVVRDRELVYFNAYDYERLSYVLITREFFDPDDIPAEMRVPFEGKIWLLVDENSVSASVGAAMLSISSGFATVVGTNTSGVTASYHMYIALPNTGIIWRVDIGSFTDDYGRSIEEHGVTPQIMNLPGMDALETVLAIIAQGEEE